MRVPYKIILCCWFAAGCVVPNYYSHRQSLPLNDVINTQGMTLEQVRGTEILIDEKPAEKNRIIFKDGEYVLRVSRGSDDKTVTILDENGEEHKILLRSQLTNDKWARRTGFNGEEVSAGYLMVPTNTAVNFKENGLGKFILVLPFSLAADILNMLVLGPSTALINPWYEYVVEVRF